MNDTTPAAVRDPWEYAPAPESAEIVTLASSYGLLIGGEWVEPAAGGSFKTVNPATEEPLAEEAGLAGRLDWRVHDIAEDPGVEPADVVVMHRVVCCYPDYERLLAVAADHARHALVFSYPPRNLGSRLYLGTYNLALRLMRSTLRVFTHPPAAMHATLERHGLRLAYEHHSPIWQVAGHERREEGSQ